VGTYVVAPDGTLTALGTTLVENDPASHPLDEGVSVGQNYLYVMVGGLNQIVGYRVGPDGSLTQVTVATVAAGIAVNWTGHTRPVSRPQSNERIPRCLSSRS
jgi:hypothetical protein